MVKKIAIITDIHANLEALNAVLADIDRQNIDDIISLGDNVGYGPNPVEVLERLHEKNIPSIEGNHDLAVVDPKTFASFTDLAYDALEWTRLQLQQALQKNRNFENILARYLGTPVSYILPEDSQIILVHGSPGPKDYRFDYLVAPQHILAPAKYMRDQDLKICFYGHTHCQVLWEFDRQGVSLIEFEIDDPVVFTEKELNHACLLVNPGSVGQPRDRNPDAAYLIYERKKDTHTLTFKRIPYDIQKTVKKIYAIKTLDKLLGDRLLKGE